MPERPVEQLTLREMFKDAERLTRDLIEHLDQGFHPKAHQLHRLVRPTDTEAFDARVEDVTVRNHVLRVLESEEYTEKLYEKLQQYYLAIDKVASRIVDEG